MSFVFFFFFFLIFFFFFFFFLFFFFFFFLYFFFKFFFFFFLKLKRTLNDVVWYVNLWSRWTWCGDGTSASWTMERNAVLDCVMWNTYVGDEYGCWWFVEKPYLTWSVKIFGRKLFPVNWQFSGNQPSYK